MDILQILERSISGYVFVVVALLVYFCKLTKRNKGQSPAHIICTFVFCYYMIGVLTMTGIGKLKAFAPDIVWIPFIDMINGPIDTFLNILLFIPIGFFLPLMYKKYNHFSKVILTGFLFSMSIELVQMFGRGATDINDLITNTFGACIGYSMIKLLTKLVKKDCLERFRAILIDDDKEVLFIIIYSFGIMVTIQPIMISNLFNLG